MKKYYNDKIQLLYMDTGKYIYILYIKIYK